MFLFRNVNQIEVEKTLRKNNIVKNENVVRVYVNQLQKEGFLTKGKILRGSPGPQKKRRVKTLTPIFDTIDLYRVWKISAGKDERQLTNKEKEQLKFLFKNITHFLDYFPRYFSWGIKTLGKRSVRNVKWRETLKLFLQFCEKLVEVCWEIKHYELQLNEDYLKRHRIIGDEENDALRAFEHLSEDPYRYIYDAYNRKKITNQHISALASFSQKGYKDIYLKGTLLQELYLLSIALVDPFFASAFFHNIEDIEAILWEDKLRPINVMALDRAISDIARQESMKITKMVTKMMEGSNVDQALRKVIKTANLDMTEEELKRALISLRVCQALERYIDSHRKDFELKLKDGKVLKLGWEKTT